MNFSFDPSPSLFSRMALVVDKYVFSPDILLLDDCLMAAGIGLQVIEGPANFFPIPSNVPLSNEAFPPDENNG